MVPGLAPYGGTSNRIRGRVLLLVATGLTAVVLLLAAVLWVDDAALDTSRASWSILPCWLSGASCHLPGKGAKGRWTSSASENKKEINPVLTFGNDVKLPRNRAVFRWKREENDKDKDKLNKFQKIAQRNGLPVPHTIHDGAPPSNPVQNEEGAEQSIQQQVLRQASDRASDIISPDARHSGKGLLRTGSKMIDELKSHPTAKKKLRNVLDQIKEAQSAKKAAEAKLQNATAMQLSAARAKEKFNNATAKVDAAKSESKKVAQKLQIAQHDKTILMDKVESLKNSLHDSEENGSLSEHSQKLVDATQAQAFPFRMYDTNLLDDPMRKSNEDGDDAFLARATERLKIAQHDMTIVKDEVGSLQNSIHKYEEIDSSPRISSKTVDAAQTQAQALPLRTYETNLLDDPFYQSNEDDDATLDQAALMAHRPFDTAPSEGPDAVLHENEWALDDYNAAREATRLQYLLNTQP